MKAGRKKGATKGNKAPDACMPRRSGNNGSGRRGRTGGGAERGGAVITRGTASPPQGRGRSECDAEPLRPPIRLSVRRGVEGRKERCNDGKKNGRYNREENNVGIP